MASLYPSLASSARVRVYFRLVINLSITIYEIIITGNIFTDLEDESKYRSLAPFKLVIAADLTVDFAVFLECVLINHYKSV